MGRFGRFHPTGSWTAAPLFAAYLLAVGLGFYEVTAKSPYLLDEPLPGWWASDRAERTTRWNPPTGFLPLDKLLHEGEEAVRFYGILVKTQPPAPSAQPRYPSLALRSSRSLNNAR